MLGAAVPELETAQLMSQTLSEVDPEIAQAIRDEARRQHEHLELIASENFVPEAINDSSGVATVCLPVTNVPSQLDL